MQVAKEREVHWRGGERLNGKSCLQNHPIRIALEEWGGGVNCPELKNAEQFGTFLGFDGSSLLLLLLFLILLLLLLF